VGVGLLSPVALRAKTEAARTRTSSVVPAAVRDLVEAFYVRAAAAAERGEDEVALRCDERGLVRREMREEVARLLAEHFAALEFHARVVAGEWPIVHVAWL